LKKLDNPDRSIDWCPQQINPTASHASFRLIPGLENTVHEPSRAESYLFFKAVADALRERA
jgi:hypothetical protein